MTSRFVVTSVLLLSAIGCGGAARGNGAKTPGAGKPAAVCTALGPHFLRFSETVEDTQARTKPRLTSYAGLLELMLTYEGAVADLEAQMTAAKVEDGDFGERLKAAQSALAKSGESTHAARQRLESASAKTAPLAQASDAAFRDLRAMCTPKKTAPECPIVDRFFADLDKAAGPKRAEIVEQLGGLTIKTPKLAKARERALSATHALLGEVDSEKKETAAIFTEWAAQQEKLGQAFEGLGATCKEAPVDLGQGRFVGESKPDPRKLTVLVKVKPPARIEGRFEALAEAAQDEHEREFYEARAQGGFGSGFIVVRTTTSGAKESLVITNRHVVELSERAELELADGTELGSAEIVYTDPNFDVAVLRPTKPLPFERGFSFSSAAAKDQQGVIATGFPGMGGRPSYQTARGYVSNENFVIDAGTHKLAFVQHTAPIDPGSSGGPLTDEHGNVLGLNTLKVTNREAVGLAVPSQSILDTIRRADAFEALRGSTVHRRDGARLACLGFVGELATKKPRLLSIEGMISNELTAEQGMSASGALADDPEFARMWENDSVRAMRIATLLRVNASISQAGGASAFDTCSDVVADEKDAVRFRIRLANWETRTLAVRVEHGHWKISQIDLPQGQVQKPTPAKAAKGVAPKTAKPKGKK